MGAYGRHGKQTLLGSEQIMKMMSYFANEVTKNPFQLMKWADNGPLAFQRNLSH